MIKSPFKLTGHYVFNYQPRYYDERKERLKKLQEKYKKKTKNSGERYQITLTKNNLKNHWHRSRNNHKQKKQALLRLALIITFLVGLVAYIFEIHTLF